MNASHLTLKRTTAIITVMLLLVVETPPTLSENIVHHQIQQQQHKQQQEENFLDKNPRHQLRPSTQITIDLNYFHIMENMTLLSSTAARRTNDVNDKKKETFFVPRNPAANMLNFPARRYVSPKSLGFPHLSLCKNEDCFVILISFFALAQQTYSHDTDAHVSSILTYSTVAMVRTYLNRKDLRTNFKIHRINMGQPLRKPNRGTTVQKSQRSKEICT
jgi:hypothetical protein